MTGTVQQVVIVGGGTAGWLAACLLAARAAGISVTLVESPDVPTIGVGEGTWPTMRGTLQSIGIAEAEFLLACDASFKQGTRFDGWRNGAADDIYHHPFTGPPPGAARDIVAAWSGHAPERPFAEAVGPQLRACAQGLAPRQRTMPPYAGALNYAYHLDAANFAALLARHGTTRLGVRHVRDHVTGVDQAPDGDIAAVRTRASGAVAGDLFIDCTGHAALLIGEACGVPLRDRTDVLFNDAALAVQAPVEPGSAIASQTISTAHGAGWIWDIGLPGRRGIGCVYSSAFASQDKAADTLRAYLRAKLPGGGEHLSFRHLSFRSAHREQFWRGNCLAIGQSAGFLEPLEASAIVMAELSVGALIDNFPVTREVMDLHARRFNDLFRYRWDRIVEFLKLHYLLSARTEPYWRAHREAASVPDRLADLLRIWRHQPPSPADFPMAEEVFPAASYQYILYGMGFLPPLDGPIASTGHDQALAALQQAVRRGDALSAALPTNRAYLDALKDGLNAKLETCT